MNGTVPRVPFALVLFVNGIPLVVVEAKIGDPNTANPMHEAFVQLLRYRNERPETINAGLREGEPRLFYSNLLLVRTCGEKAEFATMTSGHEHFHAWKDIWPESNQNYTPPLGIEREQEKLIQGLLTPVRNSPLRVTRTCERSSNSFFTSLLAASHTVISRRLATGAPRPRSCAAGAASTSLSASRSASGI